MNGVIIFIMVVMAGGKTETGECLLAAAGGLVENGAVDFRDDNIVIIRKRTG